MKEDRWETRKILSLLHQIHVFVFFCSLSFWAADRYYRTALPWFWYKVQKMLSSIVIALLSTTAACLCCWFSVWVLCVCVRACMRACVREKVGGSATYPIIIFCLSSKVFWENINYVFNKGQRLNRPPWPQPHLPWHTHTHTHTYLMS